MKIKKFVKSLKSNTVINFSNELIGYEILATDNTSLETELMIYKEDLDIDYNIEIKPILEKHNGFKLKNTSTILFKNSNDIYNAIKEVKKYLLNK